MLGHGAGGGVGAADLELLARSLPALGTTVVRFEQPWRTAGRTVGAPPPQAGRGVACRAGLARRARVGASIRSWWAVEVPAPGWLAGPPPTRIPRRSCAWRSRCIFLAGLRSPAPRSCWLPTAPRLVLQGTKDSFGTSGGDSRGDRNAPGITGRGVAGSRPWLPDRLKARSAASGASNRQIAKRPPSRPPIFARLSLPR